MPNEDYKDMLRVLSEEGVKFLLIGAYAMGAHGYPRATMDMDIWIKPSSENAEAVFRALRRFGAPLNNLTKDALQEDDVVFQIGVAPRRIDIMTSASRLQFEDVYLKAMAVDFGGIEVRVPRIEDLIVNKRAVGRTKDLADVEALESILNAGAKNDS